MSSLPSKNCPPRPKAIGNSSSTLDTPDPLPLIQELVSGISPNRWGSPFDSHIRLPGKRFESAYCSSPMPFARVSLYPHAHPRTQPDGRVFFTIYDCATRHARFFVESMDPYLSDETILHLLTNPGELFWFYDVKLDGIQHGYIGVYYDPDSPGNDSEKRPHTFICLTWYRKNQVSLLNKLRNLEREGIGRLPFWPAFAGAIVACEQAYSAQTAFSSSRNETSLPAVFAATNQKYYSGGSLEASPKVIQVSAQNIANEIKHFDPDCAYDQFGLDSLDVPGKALYWQELGKALWQPSTRKKLANLQIQGEEYSSFWALFSMLADYWLNLVSDDYLEITVAGIQFKFDISESNLIGLWFQTIEMDRWEIPLEAIRYLRPRQVFRKHLSATFETADGYDENYGDALAEQLLAEIKLRSAYVPAGGFQTFIPEGMPITNLKGMYVWTDGKGMWVLPLPCGQILYWSPEMCKKSFICGVNPKRKSAWNLILSALWHDLVTEGPKVIVRAENDLPVPDTQNIKKKSRKRHSRSRPEAHVLRLPSQRVIHMEGVHTWGTEEEIEKIKRQAHQVRGHRRRLLPGQQRSLYALENARRFNFIVPDGYTFVKPYQTGLADPDSPTVKETPILARGLASLMLMSKDFSQKRAA